MALDLITYCENEKVPFRTFENFYDILETVKAIVEGKLSVTDAATGRA
jgi:2-hydroxy-3-keto-5-methylthiopentenyl-1-phosphate phosphatase